MNVEHRMKKQNQDTESFFFDQTGRWRPAVALNSEPRTQNPDRSNAQFSCNSTPVNKSQQFFQAK